MKPTSPGMGWGNDECPSKASQPQTEEGQIPPAPQARFGAAQRAAGQVQAGYEEAVMSLTDLAYIVAMATVVTVFALALVEP